MNSTERIWEMCAYSAHCVMAQPNGNDPTPQPALQTLCMDRVDRHPWAGDSRVIQTTVEYVFGEYQLLRESLERLLPQDTRPIPDLQGIPPYTLDWSLALIDYFRVSGDAEYLARRLDDVLAVVHKYAGPTPEGWMFFDWDERINDRAAVLGGFQKQTAAAFTGKYVQLCRELAWAAEQLENADAAERCRETAERCTKEWLKNHPNWDSEYGIHAITNLILGEVLIPADYERAYTAVYADRSERMTNTPYFGVYVMRALARMGRWVEAVEMLRDYWGSMIAAGATTTWEEWHPMLRLPANAQPPQYGPPSTWGGLSLIQPAGAGPASWLLVEVVGIAPEQPGFRRVRIQPHPAGLDRARGTAATPLGPITVEWRDSEEEFILDYRTPDGVDGVTVVLTQATGCTLDNNPVKTSPARDGWSELRTAPGEHRLVCRK